MGMRIAEFINRLPVGFSRTASAATMSAAAVTSST
jgi:hypothetical protein